MSARQQNATLIEQLRDITARLLRLETQNNKTRKNDIRLSDTVVTADSPNDRLCLENLVTNRIVCIGEDIDSTIPPQAMWSFSGSIAEGDVGTFSPPYDVEADTTARQIVIRRNFSDAFTGTVSVCVYFNNDTIIITCSLPSPTEFVVKEINVPLTVNDDIKVKLTGSGTNAENISVFVRFGTPTVPLSGTDCVS